MMEMLATRASCSRISRRDWLSGAAALGTTLLSSRLVSGAADTEPTAEQVAERKRAYLRRLLYSREDLTAWLAGKAFPFAKYDGELGYLHLDRDFKEGI